MLKQSKKPDGYRELLVYKKADTVLSDTLLFTEKFPRNKTLYDLADQMCRSARSVKQNIIEGWKRNSTGEYYQFLGFSAGSNAELMEDYRDICFGYYEKLGLGERGEKGKNGVGLDTLKFYPLDTKLPTSVQLFLKSKEIAFLLDQLQISLVSRMQENHTLSQADTFRRIEAKKAEDEKWFEEELKKKGMVRLANGKVIKKEKGESGKMGEKG